MDSFKDVLEAAQAYCKTQMAEPTYNLYIDGLEPISFEDSSHITLSVRNDFICKIVTDRYLGLLKEAFKTVLGFDVDITLVVPSTPPHEVVLAQQYEANPASPQGNYEFTFENFIKGPSNQFAFAAAQAVAANPSGAYNPLFIYGGSGLGKTHLMQAIGHRYLDLHPKARVRCISAQDFISEYTTATRDSSSSRKALQMFDERYRNLDLLLIDDVQSFSGAKGSQAQFYRAFEALVPHNKQVVLTADTYTRNLKDIEQRLISRFSQGLSVAIEPPELEMRIAILLNKAKALGAALPEEVAMFIAKRLKSHVRELEGALPQAIAYQQFQPSAAKEITIDIAKHVLRDQFSVNNNLITIESIQKTVADYYNIKVAEMHSKRRHANIARPRQIAMYPTKELTQHSLPEIGANFGGRDHTTVMHAVRKITQERQGNAELNHEIHVLEQMIKG